MLGAWSSSESLRIRMLKAGYREQTRDLWYHGFDNYMAHGMDAPYFPIKHYYNFCCQLSHSTR